MGVFSDGNPYGAPDGIVCSFPVECGEGTLFGCVFFAILARLPRGLGRGGRADVVDRRRAEIGNIYCRVWCGGVSRRAYSVGFAQRWV